jgi:hypothetical protein
VTAALALALLGGAFSPPPGGMLSEKQVRLYDEVSDLARAALKRRPGETALAVVARVNKITEAALEARRSSPEEFRWIGERITEAQAYAAIVAARKKGLDAAAFGKQAREMMREEAVDAVDEMAAIWEKEIGRVSRLIGTPEEARLQQNLLTLKRAKRASP